MDWESELIDAGIDVNVLNAAESGLPLNYAFEIKKTIATILRKKALVVGLQLPEGLQMFALAIADILSTFTSCNCIVFGDVTYGACCIDDFAARALSCDLLVHYGHSCLVPVDQVSVPTLYVFVDIAFDLQHFIDTLILNFPRPQYSSLAICGTIQFVASIQSCRSRLVHLGYSVTVPQARPLSPGELLGCTSPKLAENTDVLMSVSFFQKNYCFTPHDTTTYFPIRYLGDGRFHLESVLIHNPSLPSYRYDPYSKKFTREDYDHEEMHSLRKHAIETAKSALHWGIILGTLGRQGNPNVLGWLETSLKAQGKQVTTILLSEIFPAKLDLFKDCDVFVQTSCPRLSIDWGYAFTKPLLSPYEAAVAMKRIEWQSTYPMDFYSREPLGEWTPGYWSKDAERLRLKEAKKRTTAAGTAAADTAGFKNALQTLACGKKDCCSVK